MSQLAIALLRAYQRWISPAIPRALQVPPDVLGVRACRRSSAMASSGDRCWRPGALLRCNPFSHGGYDPVSAQTLFRRRRSPSQPSAS